jgi:bacterioferritin-associated ferredoxin
MMETVGAKCGMCGAKAAVTIDDTAWNKFQLREGLVQNLFPDLSLQEREVVMGARNGFGYYCASCWDKMFAEIDEE